MMNKALKKTSVLFVCTNNICRSPTAEGIFRKRVTEAGLSASIVVASAGTHGYHVGEPPDPRAQDAAARRGYDLTMLRARRMKCEDFSRFDMVLAMDDDNRAILERMCQPGNGHKLRMMMDYATQFREREVPDPYYGGTRGFERVIDMLEDASEGLLRALTPLE